MPLSTKQSDYLLYIFMITLILINVIFLISLVKHYILENPVDGIKYIVAIFTTEILGTFIMLIKAYFLPSKDPGISVVTLPKYDKIISKNDVDITTKLIGLKYLNLGRAAGTTPAKKRKYLNKAKQYFESISSNSPEYINAMYNLVATYRELKDYNTARKYLKNITYNFESYFSNCTESERLSRKADLKFSEALILEREGKVDDAKSLYEEAWRFDPSDVTAPYNIAILCYKNNFKEEYFIWHEVLKKYPEFTSQIEPRLQDELN